MVTLKEMIAREVYIVGMGVQTNSYSKQGGSELYMGKIESVGMDRVCVDLDGQVGAIAQFAYGLYDVLESRVEE
jgi:hypothetical protein